jgi:hypothetical protein
MGDLLIYKSLGGSAVPNNGDDAAAGLSLVDFAGAGAFGWSEPFAPPNW